jgi:hypothetical protein
MAQKDVKTKQKLGRPSQGGVRKVNVSIPADAHAKLVAFCGQEYDKGPTAGDLLTWIIDQDQGAFATLIRNRRRINGSETLRAAFCDVLQRFASQVCGKPDGIRLLHSDLETPTPSR